MTSGLYARFTTSAGTFLVRLFETEIPEIAEGIVLVKAAAREPGELQHARMIERRRTDALLRRPARRVSPVGASREFRNKVGHGRKSRDRAKRQGKARGRAESRRSGLTLHSGEADGAGPWQLDTTSIDVTMAGRWAHWVGAIIPLLVGILVWWVLARFRPPGAPRSPVGPLA